jgi:hypothetical protein
LLFPHAAAGSKRRGQHFVMQTSRRENVKARRKLRLKAYLGGLSIKNVKEASMQVKAAEV